ncbi:hypothetical protein COOONC_07413 [Cooperia oncophora]
MEQLTKCDEIVPHIAAFKVSYYNPKDGATDETEDIGNDEPNLCLACDNSESPGNPKDGATDEPQFDDHLRRAMELIADDRSLPPHLKAAIGISFRDKKELYDVLVRNKQFLKEKK